MKYKEPESMAFIHSIRLKQHKETKGYSLAKKISYIREKAKWLLGSNYLTAQPKPPEHFILSDKRK